MAKKLGTLKVKRFFLGTDSGKRGTEVTSSAAELNQLGEGSITADVVGDVTGDLTGDVSGAGTVSTQSLLAGVDANEGGYMEILSSLNSVAVTAVASLTIEVAVPVGAILLGCSIRVDEALAAGDTWDAAYETGSTQAIVSNQAVALNTKVSVGFDANGATAIAADETNIAITVNGGGAFTAQGAFTAVAYYAEIFALDNV